MLSIRFSSASKEDNSGVPHTSLIEYSNHVDIFVWRLTDSIDHRRFGSAAENLAVEYAIFDSLMNSRLNR